MFLHVTEDFDLPIKGKMNLFVLVKSTMMIMNNSYSSFGEFEINISQYIYEMIVLSVSSETSTSWSKDGSLKQKA
jgi:hypothetical protein